MRAVFSHIIVLGSLCTDAKRPQTFAKRESTSVFSTTLARAGAEQTAEPNAWLGANESQSVKSCNSSSCILEQ